jgi:hypothetical protein
MSGAGRILILSDLHMSAGPHDPFARDVEASGFLVAQARRAAAGEELRLVLLGDLFDFLLVPPRACAGTPAAPESGERDALRRLERIARRHRGVLAALAAFAAAGGQIDLVPGNHDIELRWPAVERRLRGLLDEPGERLRVHPWILHIPGVLYAEHGHQHHDINAFATLLWPYAPDAPEHLDLPVGSHLAHLLAHTSYGAWRRRAALAKVIAGRACDRRRRGLVARYRAGGLAEEAARVGLPAATLARIDAVTARNATAMTRRLALRALGRGRHPSAHLHRAAREIHRLLAGEGNAVACYAFGHSHVAERRPMLPGRSQPVYVNAGTWSALERGLTGRPCPYIELALGPGPPVVRQLSWQG